MALPRSRVNGEFCLNLFGDVPLGKETPSTESCQWQHLTKPGTDYLHVRQLLAHAHRTYRRWEPCQADTESGSIQNSSWAKNAPSAWRSQGQSVSKHLGLLTIITLASGAGGIPARADKAAFAFNKSSRVCPGICGAPIVTTIISESAKSS